MPNHCECDLFVEGYEMELQLFYEVAQGPEGIPYKDSRMSLLSANVFIPMPEELYSKELLCENCGGKETVEGRILVCVACGGQLKDGYNRGGYEWCVQNWGTKWGLYDVELKEQGQGRLFYTFRSAWGPPLPVIRAMAKRFPNLEFRIAYYECGMAFQGVLRVKGEVVLEEWTDDYSGIRGG
jgi:hypothetical protein